ncbi:MAG: hypothetical protein KKG33_01670 [candidate division Zixibacteria bacterium]|nr:hypothetical protein [candidate division Zixibacteria bacterium]MBU1470387.1 hypothetical protein [candidate division Zixibacteria bacterium]MBU2624247.1 hypothetical protein [candidate division Zixibacteria bacterium]
MDDVWIRTVRQLEKELADYRLLKAQSSSERYSTVSDAMVQDLDGAKALLDQKYAQIIGFMAGLSDDSVEFDCDLECAAIVVSRKSGTSYIFGPQSVSSSAPYLSSELIGFIADHLQNGNPASPSTRDSSGSHALGLPHEHPVHESVPGSRSMLMLDGSDWAHRGSVLADYFDAKQAIRDRMIEHCDQDIGRRDSQVICTPGALRFAREIEELREIGHTPPVDVECIPTTPDFEFLSW